LGQTRRFESRSVNSGLPQLTDILSVRRLVSNVPTAVIPACQPSEKLPLCRLNPEIARQAMSDVTSVAGDIRRHGGGLTDILRVRRHVSKVPLTKLVIRMNDLTKLPPLDGVARLHFVE
jgi:hypothetical protein